MNLEAYLKFEGPDVSGESKDSQFKDEIRILSADIRAARGEYYYNSSGEVTTSVGPRFEPIRILKQLDKSTPMLLKGLTNNIKYNTATIKFCIHDATPKSTKKIVFTEITLSSVQIVRYVLFGNPAAFRSRDGVTPFTDSELTSIGPVDEIEIACRTIDILYRGADGKANISHQFNVNSLAGS